MLEFKRSGTFPGTWLMVLRRALQGIAAARGGPLLVTVVPAKSGRPRNMEQLLASLTADAGAGHDCAYIDDVFAFVDGATSSHFDKTSKLERYQKLKASLALKDAAAVVDRHVVVVDDIVTSGATLVSAKSLLHNAGAKTVTCLALARAITSLPEWMA
jgi:predicted phosphoribosyltransferase